MRTIVLAGLAMALLPVMAQAQTAQAKYDDALASLGKVTGGGPATARIAKLWVDYVTIKKHPPAAAPAAAQAAK